MGCLMNILWLVFGGIFTAVEYMIASLLMMITIVGIPFGMQTMKNDASAGPELFDRLTKGRYLATFDHQAPTIDEIFKLESGVEV